MVDLDLEEAVDLDLEVFFRIRHPRKMKASSYFRKAFYLGAYNGAVTALLQRHEAEEEERKPRTQHHTPTPTPSRSTGRDSPGVNYVEATKAGIGNSILSEVIEMD